MAAAWSPSTTIPASRSAKRRRGRPMLVRLPDAEMDLANLMRAQLYGALATLRLGIDLLRQKENVRIDRLIGHGGFFKTPHAGQQILADVFDVPAVVLETAGEGGPVGHGDAGCLPRGAYARTDTGGLPPDVRLCRRRLENAGAGPGGASLALHGISSATARPFPHSTPPPI